MARSENVQEPFVYSVKILMFVNTNEQEPTDEQPPSELELERAINDGLGKQGVIPAQVIVEASFDTAFQLGEMNK